MQMLSQHIREAQRVLDEKGDLEVVGYSEKTNTELPVYGVEFNDDEGKPVALITFDEAEDE